MGSGIAAVWGMLHAAVPTEALLFFPMPARSQGRRSVVAVVGTLLENYLEYLPIRGGNNRLVFWRFAIPIAGGKISTVISYGSNASPALWQSVEVKHSAHSLELIF